MVWLASCILRKAMNVVNHPCPNIGLSMKAKGVSNINHGMTNEFIFRTMNTCPCDLTWND